MPGQNPRWRNIREFLDNLPAEHCRTKPDHGFCTICLRINYLVAQDCPLYHQKPKKKRTVPPPSPPEARPEPIKDHLSAEDVKQALKGEDFPIIEFAGPRGTGGHSKDEKVFDVKPFDVKPIAAPPPGALKKPPKKEEMKEPEEDEAKPTKPATAVVDRDPESIVQEIMEELEFPDGAPIDDEVEMDAKAEADEEGDDDRKGEDKEGEPEEEGPEEEGPEEGDRPPVVKKEAVRKRRPKKK